MELLDKAQHSEDEIPMLSNERSTAPDATMNLLLRFETASGPRTVIASSVPRQTAFEITDVMRSAGHYAEFIDRCSPLSVEDRLLIRDFQQLTVSKKDATNVVELGAEKSQSAHKAIVVRQISRSPRTATSTPISATDKIEARQMRG
jgi:hypothetical protein